VTNPPIDPLRETGVMSLKTRFKNLGNILAQDAAQADVYVLESPVLTTGMYERIHGLLGEKNVAVIDCTMPLPAEEARAGDALRANLDRIRAEAEDAALRGCATIVLTDEMSAPGRVALPMILATGGVHAHLVGKGPAVLRLDHRPFGRVPRHPLFRGAGRGRRHGGQRLAGPGELPGPPRARPAGEITDCP